MPPEQEAAAPVEQIAGTDQPCSWAGCPALVTQPWEPIPGMPGRVRTYCAYGHQQIRTDDAR